MTRYSVILVLAAAIAAGSPVEFAYQGEVQCAGTRIDVGGYAAPRLVDWDGDGLQDLLCGQFDYGRIRFYRNEGSAGSPLFNSFLYLMDGASYLSVPYG